MSRKRKSYIALMRGAMYVCCALTAALLLFLLGYVLYKGIPNITWELLSTKPSYLADRIGILPDILNTVYIVLATLVIVLPLGVGAAIYLTEYAQNKRVVAAIEYAAETLSGIPSIIYGLVGMLMFSNTFGTSLMAGALTLVIMNLPTILRNTQESLKTVPQSYREGASGLGGLFEAPREPSQAELDAAYTVTLEAWRVCWRASGVLTVLLLLQVTVVCGWRRSWAGIREYATRLCAHSRELRERSRREEEEREAARAKAAEASGAGSVG